jgi:hypothetical protein
MHAYTDLLLRAATRSESARKAFLEVQGMLKGTGAIFRPAVVAQVIKEMFRKKATEAESEFGFGTQIQKMNAILEGEKA